MDPMIHDSRRDLAAAILSMVPGLGHIYKGYVGEGFLLMFLCAPLALYCGLLLALATFGIGMIVPVMFEIGVILHAYFVDDHSKHRVVTAVQHWQHNHRHH